MLRNLRIGFFVCLTAAFVVQCNLAEVKAQSYIFAGESNGLDLIAHPIGYNGTGGTLTVTVGIDPTSVNAADMVISTQNVVNTWNAKQATIGNISFGLPDGDFDFESVLLHEVGHSIGLGHVNLGSQAGVSGSNTDFSYSSNGADNSFTFNAGVDGVIGSSDDIRGDDDNLNYFNSLNDPFVLDPSGVIDSTTYSRDLADLPGGHTYAANSSRDVAALLGYGQTEGVMQQGTFNNEIQRALAASDVAGVRYAESGIDEIAGTADDYELVLEYVTWDGLVPSRPDIVIDFDASQTGFAVSQSGGTFIGSGHIAITSNSVFFNPNFNWHFNPVLTVPEPGHFAALFIVGLVTATRRRKSKV
ncbi:MAG: M66 family metalloprotease [Planctomycetota bacterium]